jgi:glycosyltransferase involved in cell wall biosynthesis/predicted SAM-dependent methyltransferase
MSITLPFKAGDKVLEVGGGSDPLFHPAMDIRSIPGKVDIVHNCEHTPWPIESASFDGVFAKFLIEHIGWRWVLPVLTEMRRVLRPGGMMILIGPNTLEQCKEITRRNRITIDESAMLYGGQEFAEGGDGDQNLHKSAFSPDYMRQLCQQAGFEGVDIQQLGNVVTDMVTVARVGGGGFDAITTAPWYRDIEAKLRESPKMSELKINLGSFTVMTKGWLNVDVLPLQGWAKEHGFDFLQHDVRQPLPWKDKSVDAAAASHLLEHVTRTEGKALLRELRRVMKPGAPMRIAVPDTSKIVKAYLDGSLMNWTFNEGVKNAEDISDAFWQLLTSGHVTAYEVDSLNYILEKLGFRDIAVRDKGVSSYGDTFKNIQDVFPELSLYMEARQPTTEEEAEFVKPLKIALISTPMLVTPPKNYGGLEMVVHDLAEALAELGHDVTLFATNGSYAKGCKVVEAGEAVGTVQSDWLGAEMKMYEAIKGQLGGFDAIHGHNWFGTEYLYKRDHPEAKICHTHHGGLSWRTKPFEKMNLIAISDWMVKAYGSQGWASRRVYNGVDENRYLFRAEKGDRLLFVGRMDSFKQPDVAIAAAVKLGLGLDIVGGSFVADKEYFEKVKAACDGVKVKLHLDASQEEKVELYRNAYAVLFPSRMGEPFGLIVPEAGLCGTPVIGLRDGAIPETIRDGVNGYVVGEETPNLTDPALIMARKLRDVDALVEGVKKLQKAPITPESCHAEVMRFTRLEMAKAYVSKYEEILRGDEW